MKTVIIVCLLLVTAMQLNCSEDVYIDLAGKNMPPTVRITHAPLEGTTTTYRVHFYWLGYDADGTIDHYEYVVVPGNPIGFNPADTTGLDKWLVTDLNDMLIEVTADTKDTTVTIDERLYTRYRKTHTFFVRAVDNEGMRSEVAYRSFTAFTLAPKINIIQPTNPTNETQFLSPVTTFVWEGKDPVDSPWNYQEVDSVRYMHTMYYGTIIDGLNMHPEAFEDRWSPWISYRAPGDSGTSTILGDDETISLGHIYIFAVQAKDEAGAVTSIFDTRSNVRVFFACKPTGPLLTVNEPYLGIAKFIGTETNPQVFYTPAGFALNFSWIGDASQYSSIVTTYRYGWDIKDLGDPNEWDVVAGPYNTAAPERRFYSGIHSLYIEAKDQLGIVTLARIEVVALQLSMGKNLLWVDDFFSWDFPQINYAMPTESEHDEFWIDVCSRAHGFDPESDIYDTAEHFFEPPDIRLLWKYKNTIWSFCSARMENNAWMKIIFVASEDDIREDIPRYTYNVLRYYLASGGHLWTVGKSDREGGFAGALPEHWTGWTYMKMLKFPLYLKCEMMLGPGHGCEYMDGVETTPYKDFCISVLDKVYGVFRKDENMPGRNNEYDAMFYAYKDDSDPVTNSLPDLPPYLHLWREVTRPGRFFDPLVRGFHYVEVYNPEYWMSRNNLTQQGCFHPLYRMRSRNSRSCVDSTIVAFWTTKYADVTNDSPGYVAAPSVHFGFPLWFFNRYDVYALADAIFGRWQIAAE